MRVARVGTIGRRRARRTVLRPCCPRQRGHHEHQNRESPPRHRSCTHQLAGETSSFNGQKNCLIRDTRFKSTAKSSSGELQRGALEHSMQARERFARGKTRRGSWRGAAGRRPQAAGRRSGTPETLGTESQGAWPRALSLSAASKRRFEAPLQPQSGALRLRAALHVRRELLS